MASTIIIGAGPAGLTAALELLRKDPQHEVTVLEASDEIGGISRTVCYKGNRIDIGGHRFFSKSDTIMKWWQEILPVQGFSAKDDLLLGRRPAGMNQNGPDPEKSNNVFLIRSRLSRILFQRHFFPYPLKFSVTVLRNLGLMRVTKIGLEYLKVNIFPKRYEYSLEDFFINRFGYELYRTFFKEYTEKVWGVPCTAIKPEWGTQRIKGLSVAKTISHAVGKYFRHESASVDQKQLETSLIDHFLYPKFGPGQLWETVAHRVHLAGGKILFGHKVCKLEFADGKLIAVECGCNEGIKQFKADSFISSMPVKDLVIASNETPREVIEVANELPYRDFMTVGLLVDKLAIKNESGILTLNNIVPDNWIYIQEPDVKIGRLQIFNNWSPYLVADSSKIWLGLEYFCREGDELWDMPDDKFSAFAVDELEKIGIIKRTDVIDSIVIRVPKAYPAYFGSYDQFDVIRNWFNDIANLYPVGRNGMHSYNNQDHSMLSAMEAVDLILGTHKDKKCLWKVNAET